ncbi:MAG TPA: TIGR03621 family F420-dependent LLM class oxidoreductase [Solirubrobacterales bacterium]|nr:TIGR03621 family F420-dependent LLM class oxidoreductase [Solirubrobacterales bacterium]
MSGSPHPFRFGVEMMAPFAGMSWAESARELESLGYSTLFVPDHFDEGLGPLTAMATAAAATTELRVATAVLAADFRHPAVLARELAAIDLLSAGRLEVGLGAGYQVDDYRASGIAMDPPKVRVDRLIEYVAVLRGLFAAGPFSYAGEHFRIDALDGTPHPFTPGGPPIFVAGGGPRMLRFAARHADIVGVNPALPTSERRAEARRDGLAARIDEKFALIREAAGERFERLVFHAWLQAAVITDDARRAAAEIGAALGGLDPDDVLESPFVLLGSVEEIVARLHERRDRWGYTYYTVQQPAAHAFAPVLTATTGEP